RASLARRLPSSASASMRVRRAPTSANSAATKNALARTRKRASARRQTMPSRVSPSGSIYRRSWRARCADRRNTRLEEHRFAVGAVDVLQRVADLVQRAVGAYALEHGLDDVLILASRLAQRLECGRDARRVPPLAPLREPLALPPLRLLADPEDLDVAVLVALREGVAADDDALVRLDLVLLPLRAPGDLPLEVAQLDAAHHAADAVHLGEDLLRLALEPVGERLDVVGAGERVDRVGDAGLVREDLLGAERDADGLLGGQRERLVHRVRVQRLRAAEHRGQRLVGDAHDVVLGLLRDQADAGGLRVRAQAPGLLA